jgi:SNF2 family DNA or RNA helicase
MLSRSDLHGYQNTAVDWVKDNPSCALWLDMGLGKTVSTLTAIGDLLGTKEVKRALIIAPLRVALSTWPNEMKRWRHLHRMEYNQLAGCTPKVREARARCTDFGITIINREMVPWLVEFWGQRWPYDCVVIDEASAFKSTQAKRWRALRSVLPKITRVIELTATPAANNLIDIWPQIYLLDRGERLGKTKGIFLEKFCRQVGNPQWNQWEVRPDRVDRLHSAVADVALRMKADDYLDVPDRIDSVISITLPAKTLSQYKTLQAEFILSLEKGEITAVNAAVQANKLLQLCNGAMYLDDGGWEAVHDDKLDALAEIVEQSNEPVLVAYQFKSDLARLKARFPLAVALDKDPATIDQWNAQKIPMLLAHPASAGHGLNLQKGGRTIVWFGLPWSLELYSQFNGRLHRQGQDKPVLVYHILAPGTVDEAVHQTLKDKDATQGNLLEAVKRLQSMKK